MPPAAAQQLPADSPQAPPAASGPTLHLSRGLRTLGCLQRWAASPVTCSSRKPLLPRPRSPNTELWKKGRLAKRLGWADSCTGRGRHESSRLRVSLHGSGSYPLHAPLHPQAPSTQRASVLACRACCSSTYSLSQTPVLPLHRCPKLPASPTVHPVFRVACQIILWCQHSSSKHLPQQRMHGTHRQGSRAARALSRHHTTPSEPSLVCYTHMVLIHRDVLHASPDVTRHAFTKVACTGSWWHSQGKAICCLRAVSWSSVTELAQATGRMRHLILFRARQGFDQGSGAEEGQQRPLGLRDGGPAGACRGQHAHQEREQNAAGEAGRAAPALSAGEQ